MPLDLCHPVIVGSEPISVGMHARCTFIHVFLRFSSPHILVVLQLSPTMFCGNNFVWMYVIDFGVRLDFIKLWVGNKTDLFVGARATTGCKVRVVLGRHLFPKICVGASAHPRHRCKVRVNVVEFRSVLVRQICGIIPCDEHFKKQQLILHALGQPANFVCDFVCVGTSAYKLPSETFQKYSTNLSIPLVSCFLIVSLCF